LTNNELQAACDFFSKLASWRSSRIADRTFHVFRCFPVVADLESPINGHDRALAAAHAFGDRRDSEIGFRQQVSNPADLHFRQAPAPSSHRSHLPHSVPLRLSILDTSF